MYHESTPRPTQLLRVTGGQPLVGRVCIAGAKNAATKILLATLLSDEPTVLHNIPALGDTAITAELLRHVGADITMTDETWRVHTPAITQPIVPALSRKNRIPILALGPLLHREPEVEVPIVGGDHIGPRPVDFHIAALRMMGADIEVKADRFRARSSGLHGTSISLPYPSVGATENIILAAVRARGQTVIRNGAIEPEVLDLVQMLQTMGAIIELGTNRTYYIEGVPQLHGTDYTIMPDRNEAVSFACAALATNGDIVVEGAKQEHLMTWLNTVRRMGADYHLQPDGIRFFRAGPLRGVAVETDTHPGFMTDWQQPLATVLTQAAGESQLHETVYEDRLGYLTSLQTMGADITTTSDCTGHLPCRWWAQGFVHSATIRGPRQLRAANVTMPDIRAGMAHLIAALVAAGTSTLDGVEHLERGYQRLPERFRGLGARLEAVERVY